MDDCIVVLQEESERMCGKALPVEVVLRILVRWGGLVSPTAMAVRTAPELREFEEWMDDPNARVGASWNARPCLCHAPLSVGKPRMVPGTRSREEWRRLWVETDQLNAKPRVGVVRRDRNACWHITRRAFLSKQVVPLNDDWFRGDECGRAGVLEIFVVCSRLGKGDSDGTYRGPTWLAYACDRPPERGIVWTLQAPIDRWWWPRLAEGGREWWKPLIEVLQGQPMTTHMESRAHAWELYKRADSGEIV